MRDAYTRHMDKKYGEVRLKPREKKFVEHVCDWIQKAGMADKGEGQGLEVAGETKGQHQPIKFTYCCCGAVGFIIHLQLLVLDG